MAVHDNTRGKIIKTNGEKNLYTEYPVITLVHDFKYLLGSFTKIISFQDQEYIFMRSPLISVIFLKNRK
ncbi:MAG: hypothetical protein CVV44_09530 [Spirochaetae bacterium HGW-Spirochaetae-1]|jgi:hypothetical protein|nr:MAG: hypothetical protein CVV44_09530 [Spirochaetae bacterium HGW-Spirochaetae-1]